MGCNYIICDAMKIYQVGIVIRIRRPTAKALKKLKLYRKESYDEVITRLINFYVEKK